MRAPRARSSFCTPTKMHDGRAGTDEGFGYRIIYVEPSCLSEAVESLTGRPCPLPFPRAPVSANARLARAVREAFQHPLEPLAVDSLVAELADALPVRGAGKAAGRLPLAWMSESWSGSGSFCMKKESGSCVPRSLKLSPG